MKKRIASILAVIMIASLAFMPVIAAPGNENYGSVKKISDSDINMSNGERDAAWDHALAIKVADGDAGGGEINGTTWVLWSDTAYYFYTEVNDPTPVSVDMSGWTDGEYFDAWISDSVEIFISVEGEQGNLEVTPAGNYDDHCWQFRVDRDGTPSTYQRSGAWTDDFLCGASLNKDRLQWAVKQDGNKYYVKMKITYLGAPKAGELGMQVQINDLQEEGGAAPQVRANGASGSWDTDQFGYVVLIDEPAYVAPVETAPAEEAPAPSAEEPAPAPAPAPTAPKTGDTGAAVLAAIMTMAAAGVAAAKKGAAK